MTLPSVPLEQKLLLPHAPGVYFVLDAEKNVLYIGRTKSLCIRWLNHHRLQQFEKLMSLSIAWLLLTSLDELSEVEACCIDYFQPPYNGPSKKRGPIKRGYDHAHILLPPYLIKWAKEQPEGLSALARDLLTAEHERRNIQVGVTP